MKLSNILGLAILAGGGYVLYRAFTSQAISTSWLPLQGSVADCPTGSVYSALSNKCETVAVRDPITGQPRAWQDTSCAPSWWNLWGKIPCIPALY